MVKRGGGKAGSGNASGGVRSEKVRVRTAKGRKLSSTLWLDRQLNDPYVKRAKAEGYRSRAAYKLIEIDDKFRLLAPGARVVDLGAAPGGWAQVAAARTGAEHGRAQAVAALDILEMQPLPGVSALHLDFMDESAPEQLKSLLGGPANIVLSDMAPNTTGHTSTDHLRIMVLVEAAYEFACEVLAPEGAFIAKVWQGGTENQLLAEIKRRFRVVKHVKPKASRAGSAEMYLVATGFRG